MNVASRLRCVRLTDRLQRLEDRISLAADFVVHEIPLPIPNTAGAESMSSVDLDGDGDADWLYVSDSVALLETHDGALVGPRQLVIPDGFATEAVPGDFDADGDADLLVATLVSDSDGRSQRGLVAYENDGRGNLKAQQTLAEMTDRVVGIDSIDLDRDGDLDAIYTGADGVYWHENLEGTGRFTAATKIELPLGDATTNVLEKLFADFDGDGDVDILTRESRFREPVRLRWYENQPATNSFAAHLIAETQNGGGYRKGLMHVWDIDRDGDADILATNDHRTFVWYENTDGKGQFQPARIIDNESSIEQLLVVDIDEDEDLDIVVASRAGLDWFENTSGVGAFGAARSILSGHDQVRSAVAMDVDSDGDLDLGFAGPRRAMVHLAWLENLDGRGSFGPPQAIGANPIFGWWTGLAGDLDGDGDADIVNASEHLGGIAWHENLGHGTFGGRVEISGLGESARRLRLVDLDHDGDLDLVTVTAMPDHPAVAWYENTDGRGRFGPIQVIEGEAGELSFGEHLEIADLDGDGDLDVVVGRNPSQQGRIVWYENTDGVGTFGPAKDITSLSEYLEAFEISDINGDGRVDVAYASFDFGDRVGEINWLENLPGNSPAWRLQTLKSDEGGWLTLVDLDDDGDADLISATANRLVWRANEDGSFGDPQLIGHPQASFLTEKTTTGDFDHDGDLDVISVSIVGVELLENKGGGVFSREGSVSNGTDVFAVSIADLDGDDDLDLLTADDGSLYWYESILSAASDRFELSVGTELRIAADDLLRNDSQLAVHVEPLTMPQHGTLVETNDGFLYMPDTDFTGADQFTYQALNATREQFTMPVVVNLEVSRLVGDANGDHRVNFEDFQILASNFGITAAGVSDGDFDGDGIVGFSDFLVLAARFEEAAEQTGD